MEATITPTINLSVAGTFGISTDDILRVLHSSTDLNGFFAEYFSMTSSKTSSCFCSTEAGVM